jgi:hypothetical protein
MLKYVKKTKEYKISLHMPNKYYHKSKPNKYYHKSNQSWPALEHCGAQEGEKWERGW